MNGRIKELAKTAGIQFTNYGSGDFIDDGDCPMDALQKFAELIVRECQDNLAWHGYDEAVSQLDWFLRHKIRS